MDDLISLAIIFLWLMCFKRQFIGPASSLRWTHIVRQDMLESTGDTFILNEMKEKLEYICSLQVDHENLLVAV